MKFTDARDNVAQKSAVAVEAAKDKQQKELEQEFVEREKQPYRIYRSPSVLSSIEFEYPKTWSMILEENEKGSPQIDATLHPDVIKMGRENETSYAFKIQLIDKIYSDSIRQYDSKIKKGDLSSSVVEASNIKGIRLDGQIDRDDKGSIAVFPLRDKTLILTTESPDFVNDFNRILTSLKFVP